ncbi:MAG: right-handed parallel beta-helix repeat-containing protein [Bacteroidetes bacterium]|nr:right-handed parallel beta-helix repeat-containing protein [Bacteroidota bacterium]
MKNQLLFQTNRLLVKVLFLGVISFMLTGIGTLTAQVKFYQTTDADFNKGVLNNVIVGSNNVSLQYAASDVGTWLTTTVLPQTLAGHKTVSWNDRYVYLVGGYNNVNCVNTVYVATISSGGISGWTTLNPLPVALRDPAVVIGTNTIYVMGGRDDSQVYNTIYYAAINTDGTIGAWQTSAVTLPANRWGHTATYMMGYIYVIGGSASATVETTALNTVYITKVNALNTLSAFTTGTVLPAARNRHSTVTYNNKIYVIGGYDNTGFKSSTLYVATPVATDGSITAWPTGPSMLQTISNHSSVVTNGVITVMAGVIGSTPSNVVYYANADASPLVWTQSLNVMYDNTKDGSAFTGNGQVYYTGGTNTSGTPIINSRFANMVLTANFVAHGVFVSNPFYELGAARDIDSLCFTKSYTGPANLQVTYRLAGSDGIWSNWTALATASPIVINQTKQYLQYATVMTGSATLNSTLNEMRLVTPGTQLTGNLNATTTFTAAASPYWATSDISFTTGTHTFQAGTTILFLPETGLSIGQANVICNGTVADSVKFLSYNSETGKWDGIYFAPESDAGVSSQFNYTVIANAGFGANNANLFCNQTNEPLLSRCNIRNADGHGLRLETSNLIVQNSTIRGNTEAGFYLYNSNPSLITCAISYNGGAGVYMTSTVSLPNYTATSISNNLYAFYYPTISLTIENPLGTVTLTNNTYNGVVLPGGTMTENYRWNSLPFPIFIMDNVAIGKYGAVNRLTIEPGNTIKMVAGKNIQVGYSSWNVNHGGELYAIGAHDSLITFTSINGLAGGWEGIYFEDRSDWSGATSVMDYCIVEKANAYNLYFENTYQPSLNHTIVRNAAQDGIKFYGAYNTITNSTIQSNGRYPLNFTEPLTFPTLNGNTYTGNAINLIAYSGGSLTEHRTFQNDGIGYYILDNILIGRYGEVRRLTIEPGLTLNFASGKNIQIGYTSWNINYGGELYAVGKADSAIVFKPYSDVKGDWNGIYFEDRSDWSGATNQLKYCTISKGNAYNVLCENTGSVTIDHCTLSDALTDGLRYNAGYGSFTYCAFNNNGRYPVNFLDWTSAPVHRNNTFLANTINLMALSGGSYTDNRTIYKDNTEYVVLDNILIGKYGDITRLTIEPGITLNFSSGKNIQLGYSSWNINYGAELYAVGKVDSIITFKPYSSVAGDWNGIYFEDRSDWSGATSSLKYCNISKANGYNVRTENTTQPTLDHCVLTQAVGNGLSCYNSGLTIKNSDFTLNTTNGIYIDGTSTNTLGNTDLLTCNLYSNGTYELYNNSTADVNARYNYWGTGDSTMTTYRIYDKSDNSAKGRVYFYPIAQVPSLATTNTVMTGTVKYANAGANPMKTAAMTVKNFSNATIATTTTNASGVYTFPSFVSGNYKMTITPSAVWGGVNSTDALAILNHFAQIIPLTGINYAAADVNYSHTINGTDAMLVMKRYSTLISSFPAGDYLYNTSTLTVNGSNVTNNITMLCFGDVNASYGPAKKSNSSVGLVHEGSQLVESFSEFDFPVKLKTGMQAGAISLGFYYPEQYLEITGAGLANGVSGFAWTAVDGLFRMGWCDMNALNIGNDEVVVILKMKARDLSGLSSGISLDLFEECEFADALATPNPGAVVSIPTINTTLTGIESEKGFSGLTVYPNPVTENSMVEFSVENPGKVHISLLNILGAHVMDVATGDFSSGAHKVALRASSVKPGIYLLKIEQTSGGKNLSEMIKLVVSY